MAKRLKLTILSPKLATVDEALASNRGLYLDLLFNVCYELIRPSVLAVTMAKVRPLSLWSFAHPDAHLSAKKCTARLTRVAS
jgi:hypothetical protein